MRFGDRVGNNYLFRAGAIAPPRAFDTDLPTRAEDATKSINSAADSISS